MLTVPWDSVFCSLHSINAEWWFRAFTDEIKREKEFYRKRGLPYPKANTVQAKEKDSNSLSAVHSSKSTASSNSTIKFNNNGKHHTTSNGSSNGIDFAKDEDTDYHRSDEQVNVVIESQPGCTLKPVKKKFIRCSAHTTVTHLKKFIAKKLHNNIDKYKDVSDDGVEWSTDDD